MNFTEAVNQVISICGRPDKIAQVRIEVNAALNFVCGEADFARQLTEVAVNIDANAYEQSISLTQFPRWKKFVWMRMLGESCFLTPLDVHSSLKKGNSDWVNRYYVAGDNLIIKPNVKATQLEAGYMAYPDQLSDASPTHWLLDASPYMIINKAAANIFKTIGDDASYKVHEGEFRTQFLSAKSDFATGVQRGR